MTNRAGDRGRRVVTGLVLLLTVLATGCGRSTGPTRAELIAAAEGGNILIVLLDAAAFAHFGCYGYDRGTTPNIDALADGAFVFDRAYAQASGTMLSTYSFFTSRYPVFGRRPINDAIVMRIPAKLTTIAEFMADRFGDRLGATSNTWLKRGFGHAQGTTEYLEAWTLPHRRGDGEAGDPELAEAALAWMLDCGDDPFYAYVHLIRPHGPYDAPEPYASRFARRPIDPVRGTPAFLSSLAGSAPAPDVLEDVIALYDAGLAHADALVGGLLDGLAAAGVLDRTIVVLMSDHGQCHWEDGLTWGHGGNVREEAVRVPLIVKVPGVTGRRIDDAVELVDLLPTLLEWTGIDPGGSELAGRSLLPSMAGEAPDETRTIMTRTNRRAPAIHAMIEGRWKLAWEVGTERGSLYDLAADPLCLRDLSAPADSTALADRLTIRLRDWIEQGGRDGSALPGESIDALDTAARARLRALGY